MTLVQAPLRLGIDAVDVAHFARVLARRPRLVERLFTETERDDANRVGRPVERLAARFAAKEATMKVLGVGVGVVSFRTIEISTSQSGEPTLTLTGRAAVLARDRGLASLSCSLTHTKTVAMAVVAGVAHEWNQ